MSVILYSRATWDVCSCGHYKWQHSDSMGNKAMKVLPVENWPRADGHGGCGSFVEKPFELDENGEPVSERCSCQQFTWVETIPHQRDVHGSTPNQRPAPSAKVET